MANEVPPVADLVDPVSGETVGWLLPDGKIVSDDPMVIVAVERAFRRELLVRDGELVEELGVCFADVETVRPGDSGHAALVRRNLLALTGYLPTAPE
jgi:hypothetical protein